MTNAMVHTPEQIQRLLAIGLSPITDNADALAQLGFERSYPNARSGYEATVYERSVDRGYRETDRGLRRVMVCERAYLAPARCAEAA
jgi:hypothetical protein